MNRKTTGIALAAIALAGAAQGQIDYNTASGPDDIEVESYVYTEWDGGFEFHTSFGTDFGYLDTEEFFKPTRTTIVDNFNLNAADYPSIDQLDSKVELTGETRSDFFEFSWDLAYRADFADSIDTSGASELFISTVRTYGPQGIRLRFDEDAEIRISLDVELGGMVGEELGSAGVLSNLAVFTFGGDALPNAFSAGAGVANDLGSSFTGDFDVAAGDELDLTFWIDNFMETGAVLTDGFTDLDQTNRGTLTIEVIPAPASASLLALGGLVASRRQR
jgi:hypothetical protein